MYSGEQPLKAGSACLSGETLVSTPSGIRTIGELESIGYEKDYVLANDGKFRMMDKIIKKGVKETYVLTLLNGLTIRATDDHRFETMEGLKMLKDIKPKKDAIKVATAYPYPVFAPKNHGYAALAFLQTQGWITNSNVGVTFDKSKLELAKSYDSLYKALFNTKASELVESGENKVTFKYKNKAKKNQWKNLNNFKDSLPDMFYKLPYADQLDFVKGIFSACGNVQDDINSMCKNAKIYSLVLPSCKYTRELQKFLFLVGIQAQVDPAQENILFIGGLSGALFGTIVMQPMKKEQTMESYIDNQETDLNGLTENILYMPVISVESYGEEMTYDIKDVSSTNMFYANGMSVHNCDLGSLNLYKFVNNKFSKTPVFDYDKFKHSIGVAIRGLDTLIDENSGNHALQKQTDNSLNYRNIGLGVYGYADMLMSMKLKYGSVEALEFTDELFNFMFREAVFASNELARELGAFPKYDAKVFDSRIIKNHFTQQEIDSMVVDGLRNCSLLSIAPTGSIATMSQMSGGTEPEFSLSYTRKTESLNNGVDRYYTIYAKVAKDYLAENEGVDLPDYFVTANDIKWEDRIDTQAVIQTHIDTAISSTVNLPENTSIQTVEDIYMRAWEKKIKGITIFRENCQRTAILTSDKSKPKEVELKWGDVIESSQNLLGLKRKLVSGCGTEYIFAYFDPITGDLRETFVAKGSTGACIHNLTGLSRMTSLALRAGAPFDMVIDQLNSTGVCPSYAVRSATKHDTSKGACCPMAIGNALIEMRKEALELIASGISGTFDSIPIEIIDTGNDKCTSCESCSKPTKEIVDTIDPNKILCPQCGEELTMSGGCDFCKSCGYSHCD